MKPRLDPASLQILISRLTSIAEEMGRILIRSAFSPNIKERADCSAALFDADGELLVQAEHIPVHLGSMPASVKAAIARFGPALAPGEQVVLNDPFEGGTHLNDITVVAPCFAGGRLVGWVGNRAHHADVGGAAPGSMPAGASEVFQEGLRIPPTRVSQGLIELLQANSRTPAERAGDLDAQLGANRMGVERLADFGDAPLHEVFAYGERRMRAALSSIPDGRYSFVDVLDSFGPGETPRQPSEIRVELVVDGDEAVFDFSGTSPQRRGNLNTVEAVTVSCVSFALRSATDATIPANGGALRPVTVIAPRGTIVAAEPPAAVGAGNVEVSQRIADACLGALAQAVPGRVPAASQGTMNNVLIGGHGDGPSGEWVYYETIAGGQGGRPPRPGSIGGAVAGMSGVHTAMTNTSQAATGSSAVELGPGTPGQSGIHTCMTNTKNTPIEALERAFPLRVLRQRLRRGSGGAGSAPGGEGIERDLQVLTDATVSLITERRVSQPWGLAGGEPGAVGENWLLPGGDESRAERLPDKCTIQLKAGDVLRMLTPGGGGWGVPRSGDGC
ncbi:MAG: hydantoinase B/oxoprolinase family protein [Actinobacteria bacterium]|nr:MAG: hydantoinase B/oxoprolinase family protein [Actinomycetota bacterium]